MVINLKNSGYNQVVVIFLPFSHTDYMAYSYKTSLNFGLVYIPVTLHSAGTEQEKDVSVSLIKSARVRFRPGKEIKDALKTLAYSKYRLDDGEKEVGEDEEQPEPGGGTGEEDDNQESPDPIV